MIYMYILVMYILDRYLLVAAWSTANISLTILLSVLRYSCMSPHCSLRFREKLNSRLKYIVPAVILGSTVVYIPHLVDHWHYNRLDHNSFWDWFYRVLYFLPGMVLAGLLVMLVVRLRQHHASTAHIVLRDDVIISRRLREYNRTSAILLAIVVSSLATRLPRILVGVLSVKYTYLKLRSIGILLTLADILNSSLNVVFYFLMSKQFRVALRHVLTPRFHWRVATWSSSSSSNSRRSCRRDHGQLQA